MGKRDCRLLLTIALITLFLGTYSVRAAPLTWTEYGPMSTYITLFGDFMQEGPGGRIWWVYTQMDAWIFWIAYKTSDDGGQTWSDQVNLRDESDTTWFFGSGSIIKAANGSTYLIYIHSEGGIDRNIKLRRLLDFEAKSWSAPIIVYDGSITNGTCHPDATVLNDGTIIVVFHDKMNATRTGLRVGEDIWAVRSTDNGATWSEPFLVYTDGPDYDLSDQLPTIAQMGNGTVVCIWSQSAAPAGWDLLWSKSNDGGTPGTWNFQGTFDVGPHVAGTHVNAFMRKTVNGGLAVVYETKRASDAVSNVYIKFFNGTSLETSVWQAEERITDKTDETVGGYIRPYVIQINDPAGPNHKKLLIAYRLDYEPGGVIEDKKVYYSWSTEAPSIPIPEFSNIMAIAILSVVTIASIAYRRKIRVWCGA